MAVDAGDDPKEIHLYDQGGRMVAALDLFHDRIEFVRFGPDGEPADILTAPTS